MNGNCPIQIDSSCSVERTIQNNWTGFIWMILVQGWGNEVQFSFFLLELILFRKVKTFSSRCSRLFNLPHLVWELPIHSKDFIHNFGWGRLFSRSCTWFPVCSCVAMFDFQTKKVRMESDCEKYTFAAQMQSDLRSYLLLEDPTIAFPFIFP